MTFVSKITRGGLPQFLIENVPPESSNGLTCTQPAIYFGEAISGSRIVGTGVKELDYPKGNQNVYASYDGKGGIPLDSFGKRLLFAWTQADIDILLTSFLRPESRIQIWRNVQERVSQIAPFLKLDTNPYAVLSEGKLYWIQDAYTVSDRFPYSSPSRAVVVKGLSLHPQFRESCRGHVRRHGLLLHHGSRRSRAGGLSACVSWRVQGAG